MQACRPNGTTDSPRTAAGSSTSPSQPHGGYLDAVGNTKLIELPSLSRLTGCRVLGKCEFLNPGGSSKDRFAKAILLDAIASGKLKCGDGSGGESSSGSTSSTSTSSQSDGDTAAATTTTTSNHSDPSATTSGTACGSGRLRPTVVEGTSGSTGISLALASRALGFRCVVVMPDDIAREKSDLLTLLGAEVQRVKSASDSSPQHYVNVARALAARMPPGLGFFADQFEHPANHACHYHGTGAELWMQTGGHVDAFVAGAGTGGTIAGVGRYLRERRPGVLVCLADPQGSGLANRVNHGILYTPQMRESSLRRHRYDTIVEGVGLCRLTRNFAAALDPERCGVDRAYTVSDQEAVTMSRWLLEKEGLFLGSSSALNCCAALRAAHVLRRRRRRGGAGGEGGGAEGSGSSSSSSNSSSNSSNSSNSSSNSNSNHNTNHISNSNSSDDDDNKPTIVLLLCDGGQRQMTKFWNGEYLRSIGLDPKPPTEEDMLEAVAKAAREAEAGDTSEQPGTL
jgi:cysteine synthase A